MIAVTASAGSKKLSSKVTVSIREKSPLPVAGMKDSFKNIFPLDKKWLYPPEVSEEIYKKWFVLARIPASTTHNETFVRKYVSMIQNNCLFWQENQRAWFPLAGKCFPFKIGSL